jgi:predicted enzyme related to lactoylglutathione lyase
VDLFVPREIVPRGAPPITWSLLRLVAGVSDLWHDLPMRGRAKEPWWGTVIEAPDARALAAFYSELLDWPIVNADSGGAMIKPPQEFVYVSFQTAAGFTPPVWPPADGSQRMTMHLDIEVEDLDAAVADAVVLGATVAWFQPQENVRVLLDPAGHPFCLYVDNSD